MPWLALAVLAFGTLARAGDACLAAGEPLHWVADYCMLRMETDDEIAVSGCIEQELATRRLGACSGNMHYKRRMCELMIRNGTKAGTVDACARDPRFKGRTVERGGVGG